MTTSAAENRPVTAISASVDEESLVIELSDGRTIVAPLAWYPRLVHATAAERANLRLIGGGKGIHWHDIEEDISLESVMRGQPSTEGAASLKRWLEGRQVKV